MSPGFESCPHSLRFLAKGGARRRRTGFDYGTSVNWQPELGFEGFGTSDFSKA
jgi:hypothetical protein